MSFKLEELLQSLSESLTPSSSTIPEANVQLTASSFGAVIIGDLAKKLNWTETEINSVGNMFCAGFFANACSFGLLNSIPNKESSTQVVYSSSALVVYFENLLHFIGLIPDFMKYLIGELNMIVQGKGSVDDFSVSITALIELIRYTQVFSSHIDIESDLIRMAIEVPPIKTQIEGLLGLIIQNLNIANDIYTIVSQSHSPNEKIVQFTSLAQAVLEAVPQYKEAISTIISSINSNVNDLYVEDYYSAFQKHLKEFASLSLHISIQSIIIASFDSDNFPIVVQVLIQFIDRVFIIVSKLTKMMRFRGQFDSVLEEIKTAHNTMGIIFTPLLQALVNYLPLAPLPFRESSENKLVSLFTQLQKLHQQLPDKLETMISSLRQDRRFSVFAQFSNNSNSPITEHANELFEHSHKLATQILKSDIQINDLAQTISLVSTEYGKFMGVLSQIISDHVTMVNQTHLIRQKDAITYSMNMFASVFSEFAQDSMNFLLRTKMGISFIQFILSLCSLDQHIIISKTLSVTRQLLTELIVQFFSKNLKSFLEILSIFQDNCNQIPSDQLERFDIIFKKLMSIILESHSLYSSASDFKVAENVISCMNQNILVSLHLSALITFLKGISLPKGMVDALSILEIFNFSLKESPNCFKLALQSSFIVECRGLLSYLMPFFNMFKSVSSLQADNFYNQVLSKEQIISENEKDLRIILDHPPPFSIYDQQFLRSAIEGSEKLLSPVIGVISNVEQLSKKASFPPQFKPSISAMANTMSVLASLIPYIKAIKNSLIVSEPLINGIIINSFTQQIQPSIISFIQVLQNDISNSTYQTVGLAKLITEFSYSIEINEELMKISNTLRDNASYIQKSCVLFSLGDTEQQNIIVTKIQEIIQINQVIDQLSQQMISSVEPLKEVIEEKPTINASELFDQDGIIISNDGNSIPGLISDKTIPSKEIDQLFMTIMSNQNLELIKDAIGGYFDQLKKYHSQLRDLLNNYRSNPSQEILQQLNIILSWIQYYHQCIQSGMNFDGNRFSITMVPDLLVSIQGMTPEQKVALMPMLHYIIAQHVSSQFGEPQKSQLLNILKEISNGFLTDFDLSSRSLGLFSDLCVNKPDEIALRLSRSLDNASSRAEIKTLYPSIMLCERFNKVINPKSLLPDLSDGFVFNQLSSIISKPNENLMEDEINELKNIASMYSETLVNAMSDMKTIPDNESQISDMILELNQEIINDGATLLSDIKKSNEKNKDDISSAIKSYRSKCLTIADCAFTIASKKGSNIPPEICDDLSEEIKKLMESLVQFENSSMEFIKSPSNAGALRAFSKSQRDLTLCLSSLSSLSDNMCDLPSGNLMVSSKGMINTIISNFIRIIHLSSDTNPETRKIKLSKLNALLKDSINAYKDFVISQAQGSEEFPIVMESLNQILSGLASISHDTMDLNSLNKVYLIMLKSFKTISDALNTDIATYPQFVSKLPFRFNIKAQPQLNQHLVDIKSQIDSALSSFNGPSSLLFDTLNSKKSMPEQIIKTLDEYHKSITSVVHPVEQMKYSSWNPQAQSRLSSCYSFLVSLGDEAIDVVRARLLGMENWRQLVGSLRTSCIEKINDLKSAVEYSFELSQNDLKVTNEAEKELVAAAKSIQQSQNKLVLFKSTAQEKKSEAGDNYIGVDVIDVSTPILNSAASLVDVAHQQTRFILQKQPDLENTKGLVKTASELVNSLELLIVAAQAIVNSETGAISKVLAACNIISGAIAHFTAECRQKNGSPELNEIMQRITDQIQETIKHLRAFAESALEKEAEQKAQSSTARPAKALNSMIEKLNAEARVVEARRKLQEEENLLKRLRQTK